MQINELINEVNEIIKEELTINDIVKKETYSIIEQPYADAENYIKITSNLNNSNEDIKNISQLIYTLKNSEVDSFINGLYGEVVNNWENYNSVDEAIYNSFAFKKLTFAQNYLKYIINNKDKVKPYINKYGYNITEFIRKMKNNLKRFKNNFSKAIIKIKDVIYGVSEGNVRVYFNTLKESKTNNDPLYYNIFKISLIK